MTKAEMLLFTVLYLSISISCLAVALISYADNSNLEDKDRSFKSTYEYRKQKEGTLFRAKSSLVLSVILLLIFLLTSLTSEINPSILLN